MFALHAVEYSTKCGCMCGRHLVEGRRLPRLWRAAAAALAAGAQAPVVAQEDGATGPRRVVGKLSGGQRCATRADSLHITRHTADLPLPTIAHMQSAASRDEHTLPGKCSRGRRSCAGCHRLLSSSVYHDSRLGIWAAAEAGAAHAEGAARHRGAVVAELAVEDLQVGAAVGAGNRAAA